MARNMRDANRRRSASLKRTMTRIAADRLERSDRFIEEALELVQASGYSRERAHQLVEYVFGRDQGDINQEVGGVMVTLAAHCLAHDVDMHAAAERELARVWTKVETIRAKQASKPKGSALPIPIPPNVTGSQWKDISSAPRDGTWFNAYSAVDFPRVRIVRYADAHDYYPTDLTSKPWTGAPTHWTPLLAPPGPDDRTNRNSDTEDANYE